jgi:putative ABC transport system permease protein
MRHGATLVAAGLALGLAASFVLVRVLQSAFFGVRAFDPVVLFGVPLLMAVVALLACYFPARRAMRVDPMVALRYE